MVLDTHSALGYIPNYKIFIEVGNEATINMWIDRHLHKVYKQQFFSMLLVLPSHTTWQIKTSSSWTRYLVATSGQNRHNNYLPSFELYILIFGAWLAGAKQLA